MEPMEPNQKQSPILLRKDRIYRQFSTFHVRAEPIADSESKELFVEGVPVIFDTPTVLFSDGDIEYKEQIDRLAFSEADMSDVIFNYNHAGKVMARTRNKTLQLWIANDGLHMRARLDGTAEGRTLYEEIQGGYIDRMSFAFDVKESAYNLDEHMRTITKIRKLYDVSAVDFPAYDTTSLSARSSFEAELEKEHKAAEAVNMRGELQRKLLQAQVTLTNQLYGGIEHE